MPYNPDQHHRRSTRLKDYDYAQNGAYFVTICAYRREWLFGEVVGQMMQLNTFGEVVLARWDAISSHFPQAECDAFMVMPNHVHGILVITDSTVGTRHAVSDHALSNNDMSNVVSPTPTSRQFGKPIPGSLSTLIGAFKSASTREINRLREIEGASVWQSRFYDRIIRDEVMLNKAREYILTNPMRWEFDQERGDGIYM